MSVVTVPKPEAEVPVSMKDRHAALRKVYEKNPEAALITDFATTADCGQDPRDPLHSVVSMCRFAEVECPIGVHKAVGGSSDQPTPGDVLCAAIAACLDSTLRIILNRLNIPVKELWVQVEGRVDVRGTLRFSRQAPVAFQQFDVSVRLKPGRWVPGVMIKKILTAAEESCVVIQTLSGGPTVSVKRV